MKVLVELGLTAGLSVHCVFPSTGKPHGWRVFLGRFLPGSLCSSAVESAQGHGTLHRRCQLLAMSLFFREWFSLGLLQMSWNCCSLWEKPRSRTVQCFQPLSAPAVPGFEASALGTAGGRGVWSEEETRQGIEGLLPLP